MRILITGGSGFVGTHLACALAARGDTLVNLDLHPSPAPQLFARDVRGDVRHPAAVAAAIPGVELIVHLAAAHHDAGIAEPTYYAVNQGGTRVLLDAATAAGITRVCFASSVAVYGEGIRDADESSPTNPEGPYGGSKLAGEQVVREWAAADAARAALVVRPTVVFGENNFANMYSLIRQVASGRYLLVGPGTNQKSLVYVDNVVSALLLLLDRLAPGVEVCNLVDKPDLTSRAVIEHIEAALGRGHRRFGLPLAPMLMLLAPVDAVARALGLTPRISGARLTKLFAAETVYSGAKLSRLRAGGATVPLEEAIRRMVRWYVGGGATAPLVRNIPPGEVVNSVMSTEA